MSAALDITPSSAGRGGWINDGRTAAPSAGWGGGDVAEVSVLDDLLAAEDARDDWADVLVAALANQARRQIAWACCPIDCLDILELLLAGEDTGRCEKTEQAVIEKIAEAVRAGGPRQPRLSLDLGRAGARPPSRRGRPLGRRTNKALADGRQGQVL